MSSVSYKTSCTRENLKNIRNFVEEAIMDMGLDEILNNQIILAVDEICANLIIHVHQTTPQDIIVIDILYLEDGVLFEIVDTKTTYFDFSKYQKPNLEDIKISKRKGGMGLILVNTIMDEVDVFSDETVTIWRLYKHLPHLKISEEKNEKI